MSPPVVRGWYQSRVAKTRTLRLLNSQFARSRFRLAGEHQLNGAHEVLGVGGANVRHTLLGVSAVRIVVHPRPAAAPRKAGRLLTVIALAGSSCRRCVALITNRGVGKRQEHSSLAAWPQSTKASTWPPIRATSAAIRASTACAP